MSDSILHPCWWGNVNATLKQGKHQLLRRTLIYTNLPNAFMQRIDMMSKKGNWPKSALVGVHFEAKNFHLELANEFAFNTQKQTLCYQLNRTNKSNEKARTFSSGR